MSLDLERRQKLTEDGVGDDYLGCHGTIVRDAGGDGTKEGGDGTHSSIDERGAGEEERRSHSFFNNIHKNNITRNCIYLSLF